MSRAPALDLPADPVDDVARRQHAGCTPAPRGPFPQLGGDLELDAGTRQSAGREVGDEGLDRASSRERDDVDPIDRRLELHRHRAVDRRLPDYDRTGVTT